MTECSFNIPGLRIRTLGVASSRWTEAGMRYSPGSFRRWLFNYLASRKVRLVTQPGLELQPSPITVTLLELLPHETTRAG